MTLVTVAGTSGSGKSFLMRSFLDWARKRAVVKDLDDGYSARLKTNKVVRVIGRYEVPTGGCDTIHDVVELFDKIRAAHEENDHVLYEGLFVMNMTRGPALASEVGRELCVLQLTTPLATCFASINQRRAERGEGALETRKNTEDNYRRATNYCAKMRDAGARVFRVSRDEALPKMLELLGA